MNSWGLLQVRFGARFRLLVSGIRALPSSLERLDADLRGLSSGLPPRLSNLHIAALAICFLSAGFWLAVFAEGHTAHSRQAAQQVPQGQTQESPSTPEGNAQQASPAQPGPYKPIPRYRMLSQKEERAIVKAAWAHDRSDADVRDCSHTVHQIYEAAGYEYPYASSFDLYRGTTNFVRVTRPQPGDLIAWPGHVGIVLSPKRHSFYSLVSTGLEAQDYRGRYWRGRGYPRFYRYIVERNTPSQRPGENPAPTKAQQR